MFQKCIIINPIEKTEASEEEEEEDNRSFNLSCHLPSNIITLGFSYHPSIFIFVIHQDELHIYNV